MTASAAFNARTSKISLAIAKDSGWYQVDISKAETYFWGKGDGCDVLNGSCNSSNVSEFCPASGDMGCSDDHIHRSLCSIHPVFNTGCPLNLNVQSCKTPQSDVTKLSGESASPVFTYGRDSVCLTRTVKNSFLS
jgi:hypothetical protein